MSNSPAESTQTGTNNQSNEAWEALDYMSDVFVPELEEFIADVDDYFRDLRLAWNTPRVARIGGLYTATPEQRRIYALGQTIVANSATWAYEFEFFQFNSARFQEFIELFRDSRSSAEDQWPTIRAWIRTFINRVRARIERKALKIDAERAAAGSAGTEEEHQGEHGNATNQRVYLLAITEAANIVLTDYRNHGLITDGGRAKASRVADEMIRRWADLRSVVRDLKPTPPSARTLAEENLSKLTFNIEKGRYE